MKKLIAVLIALAMILSMSVMSFAEFNGKKSPADIASDQSTFDNATYASDNDNESEEGKMKKLIKEQGIYTKEDNTLMNWDEAWSAYYAYCLSGATDDPQGAAGEIVNSVTSGYVDAGTAITKVGEAAMGGIGGDSEPGDLSGVVDQIIGSITGGDKEPEISTEAYVDELVAMINDGTDVKTITAKIGEDLDNGKIVTSQLPDIAKEISKRVESGEIENNETVQTILDFINTIGGGSEDPAFPDFGDITLPGDEGNSESGNFLDTILGIIGSIGDIFNPDAGTDDPATDDPATDDPGDLSIDTPTEIPDTGDVSFVAVAAVAAVAGAALVLTRKKHNDAE